MSIGVERVNGGVIDGSWSEARLTYLKVTGPAGAFSGSYGLTPTEQTPRPAPGSAAEAVYRAVSDFGTPVIFRIVSATVIDVALAYGADVDGNNVRDRVRELGATFVGKKFGGADVTGDDDVLVDSGALNFTSATVGVGDFTVTV